jgi:hypothetical protein
VINFVTDADDPVLGFAVGWLEELRSRVDHLTVLTSRVGRVPETLDVEIICSNWVPGQNLRNLLKFVRQLVRTLRYHRPDGVFTHMAAPQGIMASPVLRLLRVRHVLWYAHPQVTPMLRLAVTLADKVVTSVPESLPLKSKKIQAIGQGIDLRKFAVPIVSPKNTRILVHWGRCDPVKRLDYLAETVERFGDWSATETRLLSIGVPSTSDSAYWWQQVLDTDVKRERPIVEWIPGVAQADLAPIAARSEAFVHASITGFDKAALEACLLGIPVFSEAESIRKEIGAPHCASDVLEQLKWWDSASSEEKVAFCVMQREAVVTRHSLASLGDRLEMIIFGEDNGG